MTKQIFFVISLVICSSLVDGQSTPNTCIPQFSPDIAALEPVLLAQSLPVGDTLWFTGRIFVNPSAPPCTPAATTPTTSPATTPPATTPPATTPPAATPPATTPPATTPPATTPPATTPPATTPPTATPPATTPPTATPPTATPPTATPPTAMPPATTPPATTPPATTPPATTPPAQPITVENQCSFLTYNPDECKSMRLLISRDESGSISLKQATFNEKLNTVALFHTSLVADVEKAVYSQSFGYYGTMGEDGLLNIAECTPPEIQTTQSAELVILGVAANKEWAVITTCNKSVVLIIYNMALVADDAATEAFKADIDAILTKIQINPEEVKPVPCEMKIKLDHFIFPPVEPTAPPPSK